MEIWKPIPNYEGRYEASNLGRIKSFRPGAKERILKPRLGTCKYLSVTLRNKSYMVHRIIALCFCDNSDSKSFVNHKDGDKLNNHAENLEWCTHQENIDHGFANGLMRKHKGATHHFAKLNQNDVINIRFNRLIYNIPYHVIAEFFGVSKQAVMDIIKGKNWSHV